MPTFDGEQEEITAFEFNQTHLFKQHFNKDEIFQQPHEYYNSDKYRSKVPEGRLSEVRQILDSFFCDLEIADQPREDCAVQKKEVDSSDILKNSVENQREGEYNISPRKNKVSVRQAIEKGASLPEKADLNMESVQWKIDGS